LTAKKVLKELPELQTKNTLSSFSHFLREKMFFFLKIKEKKEK